MVQLKRRRRLFPVFFVLIVPALLLGHTFYEAARPVALEGLIEARKQSQDRNDVAGYSSAKTSAGSSGETTREMGAKPSVAEKQDLGASSARSRLTTSPPPDTCDGLLVRVDRENRLPPDYVPPDLVPVESYGVAVYGGRLMLRQGAAEQLGRMARAADTAGEEIVVSSAYRSFDQQRFAFARLVSIYGEKKAKVMSALPGQSQHQLGTAVDFTNSAVGYEIHKAFGHTTASAWLLKHAPEHGFVLSYPRHDEDETGFRWEPWHYRYVGVENARHMIESGATLQAFLSSKGVEPRCQALKAWNPTGREDILPGHGQR